MIKNSKRADKKWETRNSNIIVLRRKNIRELDEVKHAEKKDADLKIFLIV